MWHASVSIQKRTGLVLPRETDADRYAVKALAGVGGDHEWWYWSRGHIGHLRVPVTAEEAERIPSGLVSMDAGPEGVRRPRTVL